MAFQAEPLVVFFAIAALIFLGFLGNLIFSRLRFNDTVLLIALGVVLGPATGTVEVASLAKVSSIVGPLALILILFDGGLALKFRDLLHGVGSATSLAVTGFVLTAGLVGALVSWALEIGFITGLILGAILGGTSALVVLPSLQHMKTEKRTATVLGLESALTDVLVVVVSFTLISIVELGEVLFVQDVTSKLVITFAMSLFIGVSVGFLWLWLTPHVRDKPFGYMLTLGAMFAMYVVVEWILQDVSSGGGPLSVLAFGVVLGNASSLGQAIRDRVGEEFTVGIKKFQGEISFLVRTFFFIYLGILVDLDLLRDGYTWAIGVLILAAMVVARYLAVAITTRSLRMRGDAAVMLAMMPRGLAAAVLAAEPATRKIPGTERFVALAFLALVLTNLLATVGGLVLERRAGPKPTSSDAPVDAKGEARNGPRPLPERPGRQTERPRRSTKRG